MLIFLFQHFLQSNFSFAFFGNKIATHFLSTCVSEDKKRVYLYGSQHFVFGKIRSKCLQVMSGLKSVWFSCITSSGYIKVFSPLFFNLFHILPTMWQKNLTYLQIVMSFPIFCYIIGTLLRRNRQPPNQLLLSR